MACVFVDVIVDVAVIVDASADVDVLVHVLVAVAGFPFGKRVAPFRARHCHQCP